MPYQRPPDSTLMQRDRALLQLELFMARRVNDERISHDLSVLGCDALLSAVARAHSAEMCELGYFAHESPTLHLRTPSDRYQYAYGQPPRFLAENIACQRWSIPGLGAKSLDKMSLPWLELSGPPSESDIEQSHLGLMNSPGHRANILDVTPTIMGIGIVAQSRNFWITQLFSWRTRF